MMGMLPSPSTALRPSLLARSSPGLVTSTADLETFMGWGAAWTGEARGWVWAPRGGDGVDWRTRAGSRHVPDGLSKRENKQTMQYNIKAHLWWREIRQHSSGRQPGATSSSFSTASAAAADAGQPTVFPAGAEHGAAPRVQTLGHVHDREQARWNYKRAGSRLSRES